MAVLDRLYTWFLRKRGYAIGPRSRVSRHARIRGEVSLGRKTRILDSAMLLAQGGSVRIGDDCTVHPFCVLYGQGGLVIGNGVRIAAHTVIVPANHGIDAAMPIFEQPETKLGITIEDDVWIGAGARILDGVRISRGCVIGAGAVVTRGTVPYGIYAGVPARQIGTRSKTSDAAVPGNAV